jgi:ATP-dependent protease ClpP protease subunit
MMRNNDRLTAITNRVAALYATHGAPPRARAAGPWYRIEAAANERAEVFLYGAIGDEWDGLDSGTFVRDLRNVKANGIDLRINSGGGLVFDGVAIYSALQEHPAKVMAHVDGIAASAASFIAMAADEVVIKKPAKMMIHDASGLAYGPPAVMMEMHDLLEDLSNTIAEIYADRAGGKIADWRGKMRAETWYSSSDAVAAGLADSVAIDKAAKEDTQNLLRSQLIRARARVTFKG